MGDGILFRSIYFLCVSQVHVCAQTNDARYWFRSRIYMAEFLFGLEAERMENADVDVVGHILAVLRN